MRAARLRRSRDIAAVRSEGRSLRRAAFNARIRRSGEPLTRIAVTAPRSIGSAVVRSRARRRVREAFRRELSTSASSGVDILVTVRPEAVSTPFPALAADAQSVLREAGA
jgi:ribonuclease P protein component